MSVFSNKHVIAAFIVTPLLAVISYYLVDSIVKEKPHQAVEGQSYPLVAQSNCRYTSGQCELTNNDFEARLIVEVRDGLPMLVVKSIESIRGVAVGFSADGNDDAISPKQMRYKRQSKQWELRIPENFDENTKLMIVLQTDANNFFAETTMAFSKYKTTFDKTF